MLLATRHTLSIGHRSQRPEHHRTQVGIASHCHAGRLVVSGGEISFLVLAMLGVVGTHRHRQAIARVLVSALVASLPLLYVSLLRPPPAALAGDTAFWFLMSNCVIAAIVATADDAAGTLFFGSSNNDDDRPDNSVVLPLAVDEPAAFVTMMMKGGGEVAGNNPIASPFLIQAQGADAANKPGTNDDLQPSLHVSGALHMHQDERHETAIEQSTDQNNTAVMVMVKGHEETVVSPSTLAIPVAVGKLDKALTTEREAEPEPWTAPKLLTSKSLPDQQVQQEEEEAGDEDVLAHGKGGRLRRSATDGSKSAAEESEYWQLSDEELNRRVEDFIARFNRQMRLQIEQEARV